MFDAFGVIDPFPDVVRFESVGRCNFRCTHCPVGQFGNNRDVMRFHTFKQIFDRLPLVPRVAILYHGGEPLLNKELEDMIRYCKQKGVQKVAFNSNASLLTVARGKSLSEAGLDELRVSFDGSSPEENDKIRVGSHFDKQAPIVREVAKFLPIRVYNVKFDGDPRPARFLVDYFGQGVKYHTDPARIWAHNDKQNEPSTGVDYCSEMVEKFSILSNGDVVTCCEDLLGDYRFGNVLLETPLEIWNRMQSVRDTFYHRDYPELCRHCYVVTGALMKQGET